MQIKIDLDAQATEALAHSAMNELRPPQMQAAVLLRRALGLPFPKEPAVDAQELAPVGAPDG